MNKEMKQSDLKVGDKVTYVPKHIGDRIENGIVKLLSLIAVVKFTPPRINLINM